MIETITYKFGDEVGGDDAGIIIAPNSEFDGGFEPNFTPWPEPNPAKRVPFADEEAAVDNNEVRMDEEEGDEEEGTGGGNPAETSEPVPPSIIIVCNGLAEVIEMRKFRPFKPWPAPAEKPETPKTQGLKAA